MNPIRRLRTGGASAGRVAPKDENTSWGTPGVAALACQNAKVSLVRLPSSVWMRMRPAKTTQLTGFQPRGRRALLRVAYHRSHMDLIQALALPFGPPMACEGG